MTNNEVQVKDVLPVRSRISWGAVLAGAMTAVTVYFLLTFLGVAIGATVVQRTGDLGIAGPAIWAVISLMLALFCGGCVTSQCTVGESKMESVIYGVVLWGTMFSLLLALAATRFNVGFGDVLNAATNNQLVQVQGEMSKAEQYYRFHGVDDAGIAYMRTQHPEEFGDLQSMAQDPRTVQAAWWTFGGILLSMLAAIAGALTGAGPNFTLAAFGFRSMLWTHQHTHAGQQRTAV